MPDTYTAGGVAYQLHPPKRRIYVAEVARALRDAPERAAAACLGLSARSLWGPTRREPSYRGDPLDYGAEVWEVLADAGWSPTDIVLAGLAAYRGWVGVAVPDAEVKEAEAFTGAPGVATSDSGGPSS